MSNLLTKLEAAKRINVSVRTLERLIDRGEGPPLARIGSRVLVPENHLAAWIEAHIEQPTVI